MVCCEKCKTGIILCGGPVGKKCKECNCELKNPANAVCLECSRQKNICEYCGKPLEK